MHEWLFYRNASIINDETIDSCKMKAGFRVPEKARHPGVFRVSTPSLGDIGRIGAGAVIRRA